MTYRNRSGLLALTCAGALALTGCTPNPEAGRPAPAPPTTTTTAPSTSPPSVTPSASPSGPPLRPAAAKGLTLAAAESFVRYYSDLLNYAATTGQTTALLGESDAGCEHCRAYAQFARKSNAKNGLLTGDYPERLKEVSELNRGESGRIGGAAIVTVGTYASKESASARPFTSKAATYTRQIALAPRQGNWVMYELKQTKQ